MSTHSNNPVLIGTGFYSTTDNHDERRDFFNTIWLANSEVADRVVAVNNSEADTELNPLWLNDEDIIRIAHNIGHPVLAWTLKHPTRLLGWSMSWIIPALMAYCERCDFVYKEQDCLAFGDWLPAIRRGRASFGNNTVMPCEQSLFWIERDFILDFVQIYMSFPEHDYQMSSEEKFARMEKFLPGMIERHDLGVGRDRPLPADLRAQAWYAQKFTAEEMERLRREKLI